MVILLESRGQRLKPKRAPQAIQAFFGVAAIKVGQSRAPEHISNKANRGSVWEPARAPGWDPRNWANGDAVHQSHGPHTCRLGCGESAQEEKIGNHQIGGFST